jgi:hypothetical protein
MKHRFWLLTFFSTVPISDCFCLKITLKYILKLLTRKRLLKAASAITEEVLRAPSTNNNRF